MRAKLSRKFGQFKVSYSCSTLKIIAAIAVFRSFTRIIMASKAESSCFSSLCIVQFLSRNTMDTNFTLPFRSSRNASPRSANSDSFALARLLLQDVQRIHFGSVFRGSREFAKFDIVPNAKKKYSNEESTMRRMLE